MNTSCVLGYTRLRKVHTVRQCAVAGLVNERTLHIEAGEENISVTRTNSNHSHRPAQHKAKADKKGKNFRRTNRKLSKEVSSYRPDLKVLHCCHLRNMDGQVHIGV